MSSMKNEICKLAKSTLLNNKEIAKVVGCSPRTVNRYAGSYDKRCKEKITEDTTDIFKIQKTVLLPDIHFPHYEQKIMDTVADFIEDYEPDELVYMGDQVSLDCISGWNKRKPLLKEGQRLLEDYDGFDYHVLQTHEQYTKDDCRRTFMIGNHEQRINWYVEEHPELEGMIDLDHILELEERGYKIIPYNEIHKVGKLNVIHGFYWNKYHAAKTLEAFEGKCCICTCA
jgi:hypothetical protein